jgi:hypothetical protein
VEKKQRGTYEVKGGLNTIFGTAEECDISHKYSKLNNLNNLQSNLQIPSTVTAMQCIVCVKKISSYFLNLNT